MPSPNNILLLALVFVTVGFIGGALIAIVWAGREKKVDKAQREAAPARRVPSRLEPLVELFRLRTNQQIVVFMDGKYYTNSTEMEQSLVTELRRVAEDWQRWLGVDKQPEPVVVPEPPLPSVTVKEEQVSELRLNQVTGNIPPKEEPITPPAFMDTPSEIKPKPTTIVGQINEILQEKLTGTNKTISLMDDMHRGVIVWVGIEKYDGIDAVPYPEVQNLIREAVKEWEKRTEAGTL